MCFFCQLISEVRSPKYEVFVLAPGSSKSSNTPEWPNWQHTLKNVWLIKYESEINVYNFKNKLFFKLKKRQYRPYSWSEKNSRVPLWIGLCNLWYYTYTGLANSLGNIKRKKRVQGYPQKIRVSQRPKILFNPIKAGGSESMYSLGGGVPRPPPL